MDGSPPPTPPFLLLSFQTGGGRAGGALPSNAILGLFGSCLGLRLPTLVHPSSPTPPTHARSPACPNCSPISSSCDGVTSTVVFEVFEVWRVLISDASAKGFHVSGSSSPTFPQLARLRLRAARGGEVSFEESMRFRSRERPGLLRSGQRVAASVFVRLYQQLRQYFVLM